MASRCAEDAPGMARRWLDEERCGTVERIVSETTVPDRLMTFCDAWLEAWERAEAIQRLEEIRKGPKPDFDNFQQTPEEQEADRRFARGA